MEKSPASPAVSTPRGRYALITPCRDEAEFAQVTLDSIAAQTQRPDIWVIVDDGSTDATPAILAAFAARHDWVKIITRVNGGARRVGPGVIDAFYAGFEAIDPRDYEFICKFDLDLEMPRTYFQRMIEKMNANPRLATISGKPFMRLRGRLVSELCGDENSVGMAKFYRTEAFDEIGGFVRQVMWDGIDGHRCRMHGWQAASEDDADTRFIHLRPMGTSQHSWWTGRVRHGFGQYFMGTGLGYMVASCFFRLAHPPAIVGSIAMLWGWVSSALRRTPRYDDPAFREFLNRYQHACLLLGKKRATARLNARTASKWHPKAPQLES